MVDKKLFHIIWIGTVVILLLGGIAVGLRSGNVTVYDREYVWSAEPGPEGDPVRLVRGRMISSIQQDVNKLLFAFNKTFKEAETANLQENESLLELPRILLQGIKGTTAQVVVENSVYLSQRMGSAGAQDYLASATYTLTECPQIAAVEFDFPQGDHAAPGTYTRGSFSEYRIIFIRK
jgi:hypothetical protein